MTKVQIEIDKCDYCDYFENPNKDKKYESPKLNKCDYCGKDICNDHTEKITFEVAFYVNPNKDYPTKKEVEVKICTKVHRTQADFMAFMSNILLSKEKGKYSSEW